MSTATGAAGQPRASSGSGGTSEADDAGEAEAEAGSEAGGEPGSEAGPATEDAGAGEQAPGISVVPAVFKLVGFDAGVIADMAAMLCRHIGLATDPPIHIEIDETTPLGRAWLTSVEPTVLTLESGALEDPHRPRKLSARVAGDTLGRLLMRVRDRRDPSFGEPPGEEDLSLAQTTAWEVYAMGRLSRLGRPVQRPRWLYHFRVRHGFTDRTDTLFGQLWDADQLTWSDIERISAQASGTTR